MKNLVTTSYVTYVMSENSQTQNTETASEENTKSYAYLAKCGCEELRFNLFKTFWYGFKVYMSVMAFHSISWCFI